MKLRVPLASETAVFEGIFLTLRSFIDKLSAGTGSESLPFKAASSERVPDWKSFSFKRATCPAAAIRALIRSLSETR